jgi:16S rRNA (cytidine1402-2'-O)-methyltransferase
MLPLHATFAAALVLAGGRGKGPCRSLLVSLQRAGASRFMCSGNEDTESAELSADELPMSTGAPIEARTLYYVATPIGNLEDITLRAVRTLREVDVVATEDTRVTLGLLRHLHIGPKKLVAHHDHNLASSVPKLIELLEGGASVAVVSDAGTPGISDPGLALAAECARRSIPIVPVPGACAAVAAISVSGFVSTEFIFGGFLPRSGSGRKARIAEMVGERRAVVLYEAPHRMLDTLGDLKMAGAGGRGVVVAREMTKLHEEFHRGTIASAHAWYAAIAERDGKLRGEFAVVIAPLDAATLEQREGEAAAVAEERATEAVRARLAAGGALSRVVKEAALEFGVPKAKLYAEALRQKEALRGVRESKE